MTTSTHPLLPESAEPVTSASLIHELHALRDEDIAERWRQGEPVRWAAGDPEPVNGYSSPGLPQSAQSRSDHRLRD